MESGSLLVAGHVLQIENGKVNCTKEQLDQAIIARRMKLESGTANDQEIQFLTEFIRLAEGPAAPDESNAPKGSLDDALAAAKTKILASVPKPSSKMTLEERIAAARANLTK